MRKHPDGELSSEQLDDKYNPEGNGEHPEYPRIDWMEAVANDCTLLGYWAWVYHQIEEWEHDDIDELIAGPGRDQYGSLS